MGVRVIQRGAAVTGAHLEGRGSQGHGGRRSGRLPWLVAALINAAERIFLPTSNFLLSWDKQVFTEVGDFRFHKSRVATFHGGFSVFLFLLCPQAKIKIKKKSHSFVGRTVELKACETKQTTNNKIKLLSGSSFIVCHWSSGFGCSFSLAAASSAPRSHLCLPSPFFLACLCHGYLKSCRCV